MLPLQVLQPGDVGGGDRKRDDAHRHHLEFLAHRVDFLDLQRRQPAHHGAAIGDALDQPLLLQLEQRQPHVAAVGVEEVAKVLLDQPLARLAASEHDVFLDAAGNRHRRRDLACGRGRLARFRGLCFQLSQRLCGHCCLVISGSAQLRLRPA